MINRKQYLDKLISFRDKHIIKVITGIRRCGKSTLLQIFRNFLISDGVPPENILSINFEDMEYDELLDYRKLYGFLKEKIPKKGNCYVILDEVQLVNDFQRVVDSFFLDRKVDIYLTGSNAKLLSGEIATLLSGRYVEIEMLPLSFREYYRGKGSGSSVSEVYRDYLENSSFPYTLELDGDKALISDYLNGVFNTIVLKDVVARTRIADVMMLESVIRYLFSNIGNLTSTKKISDSMTSAGRKISTHTVENYIKSLQDSFILYQAKRFDIRGKEYLKTLEKYYVADIGLRFVILGRKNSDWGFILENIIYLELLRRGYKVYIGKVGNLEVDFVAQNNQGIIYYQAALTVRDKSVLERELEPLKKINDDYPKFLLTLDDDPDGDFDGIRKINALKFLLD